MDLIREGVEYYDDQIRGSDNWELFYHLSSLRRASLCWYPFKESARILEVGCGYGALTGLLCERASRVDAIDIVPERAELTGKRYAGRSGLHVAVGNIDDFYAEQRYDCIVVIEFLEEYDGDTGKLLRKLQSFLAPGGTLLLGFRNRMALKYICGATDEYVRRPGNAMDPEIRLHTRSEISDVLRKAGYTVRQWYYPMPDFGFTQAVYSDSWLPKTGVRDRILTYDPFGGGSAECAQREYAVYDEVIASGQFPDMANVILAECIAAETDPVSAEKNVEQVIGAILSSDREQAHAFSTIVFPSVVEKRALFEEGEAALKQLCHYTDALQKRGIGVVPQANTGGASSAGRIRMPHMKEPLLIDHIRHLLDNDPEAVVKVFDSLYQDICNSSEPAAQCSPLLDTGQDGPVLAEGYIDMIPNNAFLKEGRILFFDQEFMIPDCPAAYILYRALRYTWLHIKNAEHVIPLEKMKRRFHLEESWEAYTAYEDAFTYRNRNRYLYSQVYRWAWDRKPYKTGLVMGTFDLFHRGHLNLLKRAKEQCRTLRVGVLSDKLVIKYKKLRPQISEKDRCEIVEAVRYVDEVFLVEGDYVSKIEEWYKHPYDCYFSGDDYAENEYWKRESGELKRLGADMVFFPYTEEISSSMIRKELEKERQGEQPKG